MLTIDSITQIVSFAADRNIIHIDLDGTSFRWTLLACVSRERIYKMQE